MSRLALAALLLAGCGGPPALVELRGEAQGTTWTVKYCGPPRPDLRAAIVARLSAFDRTFSAWVKGSEISRFNAECDSLAFEASPEFAAAVRAALALAAATGGAFDPTVRPLLAMYGFGPDRWTRPPDEAEVQLARARIGHQLLQVDARGRVVRARAGVELDLDGIAQGIAVDELVALLGDHGITACMVELGGEVRCRGAKPDGTRWRIGIERPPDVGTEPEVRAVEQTIELCDEALATSGSYRRYVDSGGERRHHIVDPRTGDNAVSDLVSASVVAREAATADGLATALMVLGVEAGTRALEQLDRDDVRALFLRRTAGGGVRAHGFRWPGL